MNLHPLKTAVFLTSVVLTAARHVGSSSSNLRSQDTSDMVAQELSNPMEKVPVVGSGFQVNAVSTALHCVIVLAIQYLLVYTALAVCSTAADSFGMKYDDFPIQKTLQTATLTVNFAPMLAVLFLACRMRVTQLTKGKGNPPEWMQVCMYFCTYAVLAMTLVVIIIPLLTGEVINVDPRTGDIAPDAEPFANKCLAYGFTGLKYLILIGLYGGVLAIVYGIIIYEPPKGIWSERSAFPVAPAVMCTVILSCMYFVIYGLVQVSRTYTQFMGERMSKFENAMMTSSNAMNFAPMLAILFIGARMRALQMDSTNGNPQTWAQNCFYMCTYAVVAQTLLSIAIPLILQGEAKVGRTEGDMEYTVENKTLGTTLIIIRYVIMACIYIGFSCVIYSIFTIEHPKGAQYTPAISVTMQCVINLTVQFFLIYLVIWVGVTLKELTGFEWALMMQTLENAKATVQFCPMLAILFVGTRMRALQLTGNRGAPQAWVQDGMYMATWSIMIQFTMCLLNALATGSPAVTDEDGNIKWEPRNKILFYIVQTIRWLGFVFLYGGILTVIIGVYIMTPQTANGRGAIPLVGDVITEPYGVNDIPGATPR